MAQRMEAQAVIKSQACAHARTTFINVPVLSVKMVSSHFQELLRQTVFSVIVTMVEVLKRSVKKIMVCITNSLSFVWFDHKLCSLTEVMNE